MIKKSAPPHTFQILWAYLPVQQELCAMCGCWPTIYGCMQCRIFTSACLSTWVIDFLHKDFCKTLPYVWKKRVRLKIWIHKKKPVFNYMGTDNTPSYRACWRLILLVLSSAAKDAWLNTLVYLRHLPTRYKIIRNVQKCNNSWWWLILIQIFDVPI